MKTQIFKLNERDDMNVEIMLAKRGMTKQEYYEGLVKADIASQKASVRAYKPRGEEFSK